MSAQNYNLFISFNRTQSKESYCQTQHNTALNTIFTFVFNSVLYIFKHKKNTITQDFRIKDVKFEVQCWFNTKKIEEDGQNVLNNVLFRYTC